MKNCTLIASPLNEEGLWIAEILEVKGCITQGNDLFEVIQRAKELREAIETINGLQFNEEESTENKVEPEKTDEDVIGYFVSHKNKANGSICSDICEVLGIIQEFDSVDDRGTKAFRRHLGIMLTHLSLQTPTLSIGPWTIQCKSMKKQLANAPKWDGWKDKWNGGEESA
ncbi:type II toxin-antitoxin system HicB family antitoxin [Desulfosporosinus hippei]|uniref:Predicted nuclease of the RNAse H fold, HicB family n=1 Tax=Desulfosporosinus hippei DSM 8344 TaxID=1121419 RepID=A0A1G8BJK1_9FIRM|nr:type II toxin-antitoxin system HicB family antitoxin [Desulfosporosinus hippei]SDH33397.1 Predicted nuclease of the RNAse H fold, HicB family [Desulfosporosinus hippei DSM 8344]